MISRGGTSGAKYIESSPSRSAQTVGMARARPRANITNPSIFAVVLRQRGRTGFLIFAFRPISITRTGSSRTL